MSGFSWLAVLPARGGSRRLPLKNIAPLFDKPAIAYPLEATVGTGIFDEIHVSTESPDIRSVAERLGLPPSFARPDELGKDETPILEVTRWVIAEYARRGQRFNGVATIMPTAVLLESSHLANAVQQFESSNSSDPLVAVIKASSPLEKLMTMDEDGVLHPVRRGEFDRRSQEGQVLYFDAGSFFLATPSQIEEGAVTLKNLRGFRLPAHAAVDIDEEEDFELARRLLAGRMYLDSFTNLTDFS